MLSNQYIRAFILLSIFCLQLTVPAVVVSSSSSDDEDYFQIKGSDVKQENSLGNSNIASSNDLSGTPLEREFRDSRDNSMHHIDRSGKEASNKS